MVREMTTCRQLAYQQGDASVPEMKRLTMMTEKITPKSAGPGPRCPRSHSRKPHPTPRKAAQTALLDDSR